MVATPSNITLALSMAADLAAGAMAANIRHAINSTPAVGTNAGQVNFTIVKDLTVTSGADQTIDLTNVADNSGASVALNFWSHYLFQNLSTTAGQIFTVGGGANPAIANADTADVNGGYLAKGNPQGVTVDGTHKNILVSVAAGAAVKGRLTLWGR